MGAWRKFGAALLVLTLAGSRQALAEDGYELWLRYHPLPQSAATAYRLQVHALSGADDAARAELVRGLAGLLGSAPTLTEDTGADGTLLLGTPRSSPRVLRFAPDVAAMAPDSYVIRSLRVDGHRVVLIAGKDPAGETYAAFHFLRLLQTRQRIDHLDIRESPRMALRMLDHWDNLDGTIERGYAGKSIWDWQRLPGYLPPRYTDYARACASIGLNATVLTNVNADPQLLTPGILAQDGRARRRFAAAMASASILAAALQRADRAWRARRPPTRSIRPCAQWWRDKVDEIYRLIPDFGGFLVKANSEGQPGPQDYGRTHARRRQHLRRRCWRRIGGVVLWRAFVYRRPPRRGPGQAGL